MWGNVGCAAAAALEERGAWMRDEAVLLRSSSGVFSTLLCGLTCLRGKAIHWQILWLIWLARSADVAAEVRKEILEPSAARRRVGGCC